MESTFEIQLKTHAFDLVSAVQAFVDHRQDAGLALSDDAPAATPETRAARSTGNILTAIMRLQTLLFQTEPASFVQHLASQVRRPSSGSPS